MWMLVVVALAGVEPERVVAAREKHEESLMALAESRSVEWPPAELYLRTFKREMVTEVWVGDGRNPLVLLETFKVCGESGVIGPKNERGDLQIPEGFYAVRRLNPWSVGLLSLQLDYPNVADRARIASRGVEENRRVDPGGDIAVHGSCVSIGCVSIEDEAIERVYLLALEPVRRGIPIRVHIFPARFDSGLDDLVESVDDIRALRLWTSMMPAYFAFEKTHRVPKTWGRRDGTYAVKP